MHTLYLDLIHHPPTPPTTWLLVSTTQLPREFISCFQDLIIISIIVKSSLSPVRADYVKMNVGAPTG